MGYLKLMKKLKIKFSNIALLLIIFYLAPQLTHASGELIVSPLANLNRFCGPNPATDGESFQLLYFKINIKRLYDLIIDNRINHRIESMGIVPYAKDQLRLNRDLSWENQTWGEQKEDGGNVTNIYFRTIIDTSYAQSLPAERLGMAGLVLEGPGIGHFVIDGNHRLARRYMDGLDDMQVIVVDVRDLLKMQSVFF